MGRYNPNQPMIVGNEFAPVIQSNFQPNLFEERGYSFRAPSNVQYTGLPSMFVDKQPPWAVPGHAYLFSLYRRGQETSTGPMKTLTVPFVLTRASTNVLDNDGGAATAADIEMPNDGNYIRFRTGGTGEANIRFAVDTLAADPFADLLFKRVVDVSIIYAASAQPGNEGPVPLEINHYNICTSQRVSYGTADVPLRESLITNFGRSRWGEICTWVHFTADAFTQNTARYPWSYELLGNFAGASSDWAVEFRTASAAQDGPREIYLHYATMQITYCEENRVGVGGFVCGSDYVNPDVTTTEPFAGYLPGRNTQNSFGLGMIRPDSLEVDCNVSMGYDSSSPGVLDLTLTVKRADYGSYNNQGPLPELRALRTVDVFPGHPGIVINNTIEPGQENTASITDLIPQIFIAAEPAVGQDFDEGPPLEWLHPYGVQYPLPVNVNSTVIQQTVDTGRPTPVVYRELRFWARNDGATAALRVIGRNSDGAEFNRAIISTSDFEAFPEIADGWRQIDIPQLDSNLLLDGGEDIVDFAPGWAPDTGENRSWEVLGVRVMREEWDSSWTMPYDSATPAETGIATYGNEDAQGGVEGDLPSTADVDVSFMWGAVGTAFESFTATEQIQALEVVDPACPVPTACIPDGLYYIHLEWVPFLFGHTFVGLGYWEVQRQDDTMDPDEWEIIAEPIHPLVQEFDDYEARVGVETRYRIRYVHKVGMYGEWDESNTVTLTAPGVTGAGDARGVLIFTSNVDPGRNLAYVQVWEGAAAEEFDFVEAATRDLQRMYGRDYQVAFRPIERGGVQFSRNMLVNAATIPVETLSAGFVSLRDLAWADLPYVCVRSEKGDRWLSNVNVPGGTIRNKRRLYVAEVQITEIAGEPFAPEPTYCEGLTARGSLPSTVYEPRYATTPEDDDLTSYNLDLRAQLRLDNLGQIIPLVGRYNQNSGRGWLFNINEDNTLSMRVGTSSTAALFTSDPWQPPHDAGELWWARVVYTWNGGGTTSTAAFYTSVDGTVWTPLAHTIFSDPPIPALVAAQGTRALPLTVGATYDGTADFKSFIQTGGAGGWNGVILQVDAYGDVIDPGGAGLRLIGIAPDANASTPDQASLDIVGDIDIRAFLDPNSWASGSPQSIVSKFVETGDQRSWRLILETDGRLRLRTSANGIATSSSVSTVAIPAPAGAPLAVRVTLDVDNGAAGRTYNFYTAPSLLGPWTALGAPVTVGGITTLFASTAPLEVGAINNGATDVFDGSILAVQVYQGISGVLVANPDFAAQPDGTMVFVDSVGLTWTLGSGLVEIENQSTVNNLFADPDFTAVAQADNAAEEFEDGEGNQWNVAGGVCTVDRRL
jgi:hypothetical protein